MFNEENTIQDYIIKRLKKQNWNYIPPNKLIRKDSNVLLSNFLISALKRLNPEIKEKPERADEVIYKLRAIILSVRSEGLIKANEEFTAWLKAERSMPFGKNNQHVTVRLIDFENILNNEFIVTTEFSVKYKETRRADIVLFVNGIPLVVGECKTPVRSAISWLDAAIQINEDYELNIPNLFVPNVFSFGTEGKTYRYAAIRTPVEYWIPWREFDNEKPSQLEAIEYAITEMCKPSIILDILQNFMLFSTSKKYRKIKVICRAQQFEAANKIVNRVCEGYPKKGLIWHFQGSGKSLLMVFAAQKLRMLPKLKNPTIIIVIDRIDLESQISATFNATDIPNTVLAYSKQELINLLRQDIRKIIITTIYKFAESEEVLNERENIIVMVDEAHRTQEGDLGMKMRKSLPNAFFFGLTGTPINRLYTNTFVNFGAEEDKKNYLSRYSFEESIRDGATLPLHFEPRLVEMHVDQEAIDEEVAKITDYISEDDAAELTQRAGRMAIFVQNADRINKVTKDVVEHYKANVEPNGFKAMLVSYNREGCVMYKKALDKLLREEESDIVMTTNRQDPQEWKQKWSRKKDKEGKVLDKFRDPEDPLKIIIVTSKLLTGFDAPILQTMYMDKILKDHTLIQAVCRTNRPLKNKTHGLIVDYIGIFDNVAKTLTYDEENIRRSVENISAVKDQFDDAIKKCLEYFKDVDRTISGYEGLIAAQECLPDNEIRDKFAEDFSLLSKLWEIISPNPMLLPYKNDYRWLAQVYESVQPPSGNGRLIWRALGQKTIDIINEHIHVEAIRDDLDQIVLDDELIKDYIKNHKKTYKVIEVKLITRLRKHRNKPKFIELGKKLEELKERYEQGFYNSLEYLKELLKLAKEVLEAEREAEPEDERKKAKAALTELFHETKSEFAPKMIERIVNDIDEIVRIVRFEGWQWTIAGEREVKKALRKTLLKYKLHKEQELFDRAYNYIREYY